MKRYEKLAGLAAVAALIVYSLACRPAWSPDGTRVVFTYGNDDLVGLAMHDLRDGSTRSLISFSGEMRESTIQTIFDGERVLALRFDSRKSDDEEEEGREITLFVFDSATSSLSNLGRLWAHDIKISPAVAPVSDGKGGLWLGGVEEGGPCLVKIDLKENSMRGSGPFQTMVEGRRHDKIYVLGKSKETIYFAAGSEDEGVVEIGTFCPEKEEFHLLARESGLDMESSPAFVAAASDGSRICVPLMLKGETLNLLFVEGKGGNLSRFTLPMKVESGGGVVFAPGSRTVWTAFITDEERGEAGRPILAEIDPEKGILRQVEIPMGSSEADDQMGVTLQPSISPDGRWLALNSSYAVEDPREGRLLLLDLEAEKGVWRDVAPPWPRR